MQEEVFLDAKNGDSSHVSQTMLKEEEILSKSRLKEEEEANEPKEAELNETQFSKLDELLTQTQLYSEFLLEKMDDITVVYYPIFLHGTLMLTFSANHSNIFFFLVGSECSRRR